MSSFIEYFLSQHQSDVHDLDPVPHSRLFGPTYGLDKRLFAGDRLKPDVRQYVLTTLGDFWSPMYGTDWNAWSIVYFSGSEASEWTGPDLVGNNDFDVLIGVNYDAFREMNPDHAAESDQDITDMFNDQFRAGLDKQTDQVMITIEGRPEGPFSNTWYVNPNSYDIVAIKPYAAYDVTNDKWAVHPPHLPDWSINSFPPGVIDECRAAADLVKAILSLPEPMRTQQAYAYWQYMHGDRSRAFGPSGEGWYDPANVIEKWLDQTGLLKELINQIHGVSKDPSLGYAPTDWSNTPVALSHLHRSVTTSFDKVYCPCGTQVTYDQIDGWQHIDGSISHDGEFYPYSVSDLMRTSAFPKNEKCEYCKKPATQRVIHSEGMAYIPTCDKHLNMAKDDAAACTPDGSYDESNINSVKKVTAGSAQLDVTDYDGEVGNRNHITRNERGMMPIEAVKHLWGAKGEVPGEHRNRLGQDWEDFKSDISANGIKDPIFITVDHNREPVINEGNHRRDAAVELGHSHVPVEVRYFGHAEQQGTVEDRAVSG